MKDILVSQLTNHIIMYNTGEILIRNLLAAPRGQAAPLPKDPKDPKEDTSSKIKNKK